ncbi:MAG: amidohydrolase [Bacteroidales bacterium]|nr:amidohydrolase [Bacteroidales bacterium]
MRKLFLFLPVLILLLFSACNQMKEKVDLVVYNTKVYTVDNEFSVAESFAVKDGKFYDVGTNEDILSKYSSDKNYNAVGLVIYPGFIDGHCHFFHYGMGILRNADLTGTSSFNEILEILKEHQKNNQGEWLIGRGWDQNDWGIMKFPDKEKLDKLFPDTPVYLVRIDGHAALVNSKALEKAGITKNTKISGGEIFIKNGEPTGILIDNAIELVSSIIPKPDRLQKEEALLSAQKNCFLVGLTSIVDAGLPMTTIKLIDSLQKSGELKMRINAMLSSEDEKFEENIKNGIIKTPRLTVRSIKLFSDGALGSRGAMLKKPYSDDEDNCGFLVKDTEYYNKMCKKAYDNGFQVNTHAIGDSAVKFMLLTYGEILKDTNDLRWRIEHSQIIDTADINLYNKYSIIPSIQATHATSDMYWAEYRLGKNRMKGAYAYKYLFEQNGWLINGTDFPIEKINPMYTFYASVVRKDLEGYPEDGFQMENALSREEALKSMTIWAAKGSFEENEKGSIEKGKLADFVILTHDIMKIPEVKIPDVKVVRTYINGEAVFAYK